VLAAEEAWMMVDILKDVVRRPGGTGYGSVYARGNFRIPTGGKTGTTNDGNDVWYIGFTADLVAGVWMGLDRPQKIKADAQGGVLAAPAWTAFMTEVYQRKPAPPDWPRPEPIISRDIDGTTGLLQNPFCPREVVYREFYLPGTEPIRECDVHTPFMLTPADSLGLLPPSPASMPTPGATQPGAVRIVPGTAPLPPRPDSNPFRLPPAGGTPPVSPPPAQPPTQPPPVPPPVIPPPVIPPPAT
jgi:penicillin-binding protein 1A